MTSPAALRITVAVNRTHFPSASDGKKSVAS